MVSGRADPERDGVADYARHLSTALRDLGEEVVPVRHHGDAHGAIFPRDRRPNPPRAASGDPDDEKRQVRGTGFDNVDRGAQLEYGSTGRVTADGTDLANRTDGLNGIYRPEPAATRVSTTGMNHLAFEWSHA